MGNGRLTEVRLEELRDRLGCDVAAIPGNVLVLGREGEGRPWIVHRAPQLVPEITERRLRHLLRFLDVHLRDQLPPAFWTLATMADGWRERRGVSPTFTWVQPEPEKMGDEWWGGPGEVPRLSPTRPGVVCFAAHRGDPSAVLVPEGHFLADGYRHLFLRTRLADGPWHRKQPVALFAGRDHGDATNVPGLAAANSRRFLAERVAAEGLDVEVHLGQPISRRRQLRAKYLIDTDGLARTWDSWAWKMASRSLLVAVDSAWDTYFSGRFEPSVHYVPVARDLSDLREQLAWCRAHEEDCHRIAAAGADRAGEVYTWSAAAAGTAEVLARHLG